MMDKDTVSISTVQLKPDYAASEVYSTVGSEAPPAYKMRSSNSVQIAKIISMAVIVSSLIIGCFILASSYIQARTACDQMSVLDNMLGKELMLESLQDLPKPEALESNRLDEAESKHEKIDEPSIEDQQREEDRSEDDGSNSENDLSGDAEKVHIRMPMELDLSDLAGALLMNQNQQSRMNCVVERRRTEEVVDSPARNVQLPFGMNVSTDPKKQKITGERIAIFCDNGNEKKEQSSEAVPRVVAMQAIPIQFRPQFPLTHMPIHQMNQAQQQQQQQPEMPKPIHHPFNQGMPQFRFGAPQPQQIQLPQNQFQSFRQIPLPLQPIIRQIEQSHSQEFQRPEQQPEVRIQLQRIALPIRAEIPQEQVQEAREEQQQQQQPQTQYHIPPQVHVQRIPLAVALQRAGITAEDLKNIQRMAEQRFQHELRELAQEEQEQTAAQEESTEEDDSSEENRPHPLAYGRMAFGRSLAQPVNLPVPIQQIVEEQQQQQAAAENAAPNAALEDESARPHYVQPRSV